LTGLKTEDKRIVKNTAFLYVRMLVNILIGIYTSRAILDALGVDDYGIYNVVGGFVGLTSVFTSSLTSAATRFITVSLGRDDREELQITYSSIFFIFLFISFIILIVGEIFGIFFLENYLVIPPSRLSSAQFVFHCSLFVFIVNFLSVPNTAIVTAHEKMDFFAVISVGQSMAKLMIAFSLYMSESDRLILFAALMVAVDVVVRSVYGLYCSSNFPETKLTLKFTPSVLKDIFGYSVWATIGSSSAILKEQGVNVLINLFCGVAMNAARGVSMQVSNMINQFSRSIGMAISPQIMKSFASGNRKRAINLTLFQGKAQGTLLLFLIMPILLETPFLLGLWLKDVPNYAVTFTRWALILCFVRTLENTHTPLFLANGKIKFLEITAGGVMLLNIPLSFLFLKMGYPPVVTMEIGVVIEILCTVIAFGYLRYSVAFPMWRFFKETYFPLVLAGITSAVSTYYLLRNHDDGFIRFICSCAISLILTALISYLIVLSKSEREIVRGYIKKTVSKRE